MIRKLTPVVCLLLALLLCLSAQAASLVNSGGVVQVQDSASPTSYTAQSNAARVGRMLDNDPSTCYSYTTWTSTGHDETPELSFDFYGVSLSEIWVRVGDQSSYTNYFANARPATIRVRVTAYGSSYDYTYAIDDVYDTTTTGHGWMKGYQALALPMVLSGVTRVELFISEWNTGSTDRYNVCISDILFAGNPTPDIDPTPAPYDPYDPYDQQTYKTRIPATLNQRMATRSGPGTTYDELGSYFKDGYDVTVLTRAYDTRNGIWWVQVEFSYSGQLRRAYTGVKRVNVDLNMVPEEYALTTATVDYSVLPAYGPGSSYAQHRNNVDAGTKGTVYAFENGYAQFEFLDKGTQKSRRVWVPTYALTY